MIILNVVGLKKILFLQEFFIWVGKETSNADIQCLFGVPNYASIQEDMVIFIDSFKCRIV